MRAMILAVASVTFTGVAVSQEAEVPVLNEVALMIREAPAERFEEREVTGNSFRVSYDVAGLTYEVCYNCDAGDDAYDPLRSAGLYFTVSGSRDGSPFTEVYRAWTPPAFTPSADSCVREDRVIWSLGDIREEPGAKQWCLRGFANAYQTLVSRAM